MSRDHSGITQRSQHQIGRNGWSNHRWIVGIKLCWRINDHGEVVDWSQATANTHDRHFLPLIERFDGQTITSAASGTKGKAIPANLQVCRRGA